MNTKIKALVLMLMACTFFLQVSAQDGPGTVGNKGKCNKTFKPKPNWKDSYQANGLCWCDTTFDHDLGNVKKVWYTLNGKRHSIKKICNELKKHPKYRKFKNGDPVFNDVQCGRGPANTTLDEKCCPGRTDMGSKGCKKKGKRWDINWLKGRKAFKNNNKKSSIEGQNEIELLDNNTSFVYPNPVSGNELIVEAQVPVATAVNVSIINVVGQTVLEKDFGVLKSGSVNLTIQDIKKYAPKGGIYFVRVDLGKTSTQHKIFIE